MKEDVHQQVRRSPPQPAPISPALLDSCPAAPHAVPGPNHPPARPLLRPAAHRCESPSQALYRRHQRRLHRQACSPAPGFQGLTPLAGGRLSAGNPGSFPGRCATSGSAGWRFNRAKKGAPTSENPTALALAIFLAQPGRKSLRIWAERSATSVKTAVLDLGNAWAC